MLTLTMLHQLIDGFCLEHHVIPDRLQVRDHGGVKNKKPVEEGVPSGSIQRVLLVQGVHRGSQSNRGFFAFSLRFPGSPCSGTRVMQQVTKSMDIPKPEYASLQVPQGVPKRDR